MEIDIRLNPNLTTELSYTDLNDIAHKLAKAVMNVIPKKWSAQDFDDIRYYDVDEENDFFQPMEILCGKSYGQFMLKDTIWF